MLEFVNDPQFDGLPLVGEGHVLVARRTECGRAARWVPGGSVVALAEFLGPEFPVLDNKLYERRQIDGALLPVDLSDPMWVFVPPAGEPAMFAPVALTPRYAQVVEVGEPGLTPAEVLAEIEAVSGVSEVSRGPSPLTDEVKAAKAVSKAKKLADAAASAAEVDAHLAAKAAEAKEASDG